MSKKYVLQHIFDRFLNIHIDYIYVSKQETVVSLMT